MEESPSVTSFLGKFLGSGSVVMSFGPPEWLAKYVEKEGLTFVETDRFAVNVEMCNYFLMVGKSLSDIRNVVGDKMLAEISNSKKPTIAMWG